MKLDGPYLGAAVSLEASRAPPSHSRFPESACHSRFPYLAENRFFYRKTGNFHRKNDQEKISEIFVHVAPEKTWLNQLLEKSWSKNSFWFISSRFRSASLLDPGFLSSHSWFPYPAENRLFYRKTGFFYRKNDQEKISEIFVHVDPKKTGLNELSKKVARKIHFNSFPAVSKGN